MSMDEQQRKAFEEAVERKKDAAREASHHPRQSPTEASPVNVDASGEMQPGLQTDDRQSQDTISVRDKNSGHGKKTADKWNQ
jgi:hypothetical protein